jgi:hypothetical protein
LYAESASGGRLPVDSFIDRVWERDGEFGKRGTLGARFELDELPCKVPIGDVGDAPLGGPGLFVPPFLPPPLNLPLLQTHFSQLCPKIEQGKQTNAPARRIVVGSKEIYLKGHINWA